MANSWPSAPITGTFTHLPFEQFARQLEAQAPPVHLYFDPKAVDSLFVTLQVQAQPLRTVLEQALQKTAFHFVIDDEGRVLVASGPLDATLPDSFLRPPAWPMAKPPTWPMPTRPAPRPPAARAT
jgi:hypothetical protein